MKFERSTSHDELDRIQTMLDQQRVVVMRAELEYERFDVLRETLEARLIEDADGKSIAAKKNKAKAGQEWADLQKRLVDLKKIAENERMKFKLIDKEWLRVYSNNKLDGHVMKRQGA